jgi:hypothetical protein
MASANGADAPGSANNPIPAYRGQTLTLIGSNLNPGEAVALTLTKDGANDEPVVANPTSTSSLIFAVPPNLPFGTWEIKPKAPVPSSATPDQAAPKPVTINVAATIDVKGRAPKIDAVSPQVLYPKEKKQFTAIGSGFVEGADDYYLHFLDDPSPIRCPGNKDAGPKTLCYTVKFSDDHQQIIFTFGASADLSEFAGKRRFTVSVGGSDSGEAAVTFSKVASDTPRYWALALLAGIILIVYLILRAGEKNISHTIDRRTYFLTALFLDKQTNTYSLSQCQFYAWTAASILGYIYLATAKSMIQGSMAFPDIPAGLPGILLASAGTTVLAAGISNSKGDKGSGDIHPSLADFISAGGVVAAERLQFVVWTIVGVVTFVRLVLLSDPATINGLPEIPSGFLQLMGISSAGYLGGKLARKAGPTITTVTATGNTDSLTLELKGIGLSQNASFSIGDDVVPQSQIQGDKTLDSDQKPRQLPEIVQKDDTNNEPGFAKVLRLKITPAKPAWLGANSKITITNPDQQAAVAQYTVEGPASTTPATPTPPTPALKITPPTLPNADATNQVAYDQTVAATGGTPKYSWSVTPALPAGLDLDKDTGAVTGTPKAPSSSTKYTFQVTDSTGASDTVDIQIAVT